MTPDSRTPLKAVVFDLDGTLIDSAPDIAAALNHALALDGLAPLPLEQVRPLIGDGVRALIAKALRRLDVVQTPEQTERLYAAFQAEARRAPVARTRVYDGVTLLLAGLKGLGLGVGICTNKTQALARIIVDALPFAGSVDVLIGGDGPYAPKPDPAGLLAAVSALGASPQEAVYVGDLRVDWLTARAAGVRFVGMDHGHWPRDDPDLAAITPSRGAAALAARLESFGPIP
jgi:phosphoglycolate phosphatase